jgi:flagellin-like hook-associated protein FlgL
MAKSFFRAGKGLQIDNVVFLGGAGAPNGGDADLVGIGSIYLNETNGSLYQKIAAGSGPEKWEKKASQSDLDAISSATSWLEPADIHDETTPTLAAAKSDMDTDDDIDGVAVTAGMRILFSGLSGENNNVYVVSGSTGAWTLTEDVNTATAGDTLYVSGGTHGGHRHTYNGTIWVQTDQASSDELGYLRTFVGKVASGTETPDYTSVNYILDGDSLVTAMSKLDAQIKANADAASANGSAITSLQSTVSTNGSAISSIQSEQSTQNTNISNNASAITTIQGEQTTQNTAIGNAQSDATTALNRVGNTADYTSNNTVVDGDTAAAAIGKLDAELGARIKRVTSTNVTAATSVDSVSVDSVFAVEWLVTCSKTADKSDRETLKIVAVHNGDAAADANAVDWTEYARLDVGNTIAGLNFDVTVSGTGVGQTMNLRISSTDAVDVSAVRIAS